MKTAIK